MSHAISDYVCRGFISLILYMEWDSSLCHDAWYPESHTSVRQWHNHMSWTMWKLDPRVGVTKALFVNFSVRDTVS